MCQQLIIDIIYIFKVLFGLKNIFYLLPSLSNFENKETKNYFIFEVSAEALNGIKTTILGAFADFIKSLSKPFFISSIDNLFI